MREHRRADELFIEADGLPLAEDALPEPPAGKAGQGPAGK